MTDELIVIIGAGGIGMAIARRQGFGRKTLLARRGEQALNASAADMRTAGYEVETQVVDVTSRESVRSLAEASAALGTVSQVIHAAGVSPNMGSIEKILEVDVYGTALVLEEFGRVVDAGGAGLVVSSAAGHMLPALTPEQDQALASTPVDELLALPFLQPDAFPDTTGAYMMAKRANALRVQAEAVIWGDRGARLNTISPGLIATEMGQVELDSPAGDAYRATVAGSPAKRLAPPEEIAVAAAYLLGPDAGFVTGSDLLIDGGGVAAIRAGRVSVPR